MCPFASAHILLVFHNPSTSFVRLFDAFSPLSPMGTRRSELFSKPFLSITVFAKMSHPSVSCHPFHTRKEGRPIEG